MAIVGENRLMPGEPDCSSILVNCSNAYVRTNYSWVLGRILRDHIDSHEINLNNESIHIDIFTATGNDKRPEIDRKWIFSWVVIFTQHVLAVVPWIKYGDWTIFMVTICGTIGALAMGMLPQWILEKWVWMDDNWDKRKTAKKIVALTRGNGYHHVMVFISEKGSPGWDMEALAGGAGRSRSETRWICGVLALWWVLLLITVSGLKEHTWFLVGVGGIGMLQNIYLAGAPRKPEALNVRFQGKGPRIIGHRLKKAPDVPLSELVPPGEKFQPLTQVGGVMGALMALEEELPGAGASLLPVFFPGSLTYEPGRLKFQWEKDYWKDAIQKLEKPKAVESPPPNNLNAT
jgi:hypothetical protein